MVIVEDVVTSGGQVVTSCGQLKELGANIDTAVCVIDRQAGGAANLANVSLKLRPLLILDQLNAS